MIHLAQRVFLMICMITFVSSCISIKGLFTSKHDMRITSVYNDVTPISSYPRDLERPPDKRLYNVLSLKIGHEKCGPLEQTKFSVIAGGGDTFSVPLGKDGIFLMFNAGDRSDGPTLGSHDQLIINGASTDPEVIIAPLAVSFCYPELNYGIVLFRQTCAGPNWNNSFESITFKDGVTFLDPDLFEQIDKRSDFFTERRLRSFGLESATREELEAWRIKPMPQEMLPSQESLKACSLPPHPVDESPY